MTLVFILIHSHLVVLAAKEIGLKQSQRKFILLQDILNYIDPFMVLRFTARSIRILPMNQYVGRLRSERSSYNSQ
jgi:hypothetical protein